jgi:bifunctional N-acetylglucosamine-1-phosphate-uridyltransferase/glucosamine-1-phosphate-acetyltransferase GlmU-like protein
MGVKVIVLAAGKGTRLKSETSDLPKALRTVNGKPLIRYVLENLSFVKPSDITIVVGFRKEQVMAELGDAYNYAEQTVLDGTAHAVEYARDALAGYTGAVLVCYCDMPFLSAETFQGIINQHINSGADQTAICGFIYPIPAYGRFIRDSEGRIIDVVEESAATEEQKKIAEVNIGIQVFNAPEMWDLLAKVPYDPLRNPPERYLTAAVGVYVREGKRVETFLLKNTDESRGVNTLEELHEAETLLS